MDELLKKLVTSFDFKNGIKLASTQNDLLPSRLEDKVSGELGKQYIEHIIKQISENKYEAVSAEIVHVPKPGFATRPAALLKLSDRLIYECLVNLIKDKVEKNLVSDNYLLWPRANYVAKKWGEFERAPIGANETYVINIDITAFYDSIDHSILEDKIVELTGERDVASCLKLFLDEIMGIARGIPQGLLPSDTLATLYLQSLDSAMLRSDFNYWRHGDDMRMTANTISQARKSIAVAEMELRKLGLVLNASKCTIRKTENYDIHLEEVSEVYKLIKQRLYEDNVDDATSDDDKLRDLMDEAQLDDQIKWDLFYHETISVEDVIEQISHHLEPDEVEISIELYNETIIGMPGGATPLPEDQFHVQLKKSLLRLAAAKVSDAIDNCSQLIAKFPEKTELVCSYLVSVAKKNEKNVILQIEDIIDSDLYLTSWQITWIYRVLTACDGDISDATLAKISANMLDQHAHWLERVEAMKLLAKREKIEISTISKAWEVSPSVYRADLIAAASYLAPKCSKSKRFLEGTKQQPIEKVIARHFLR